MKISCVSRDKTGTGASRNLRKEDFIPGVVYGREKEPENLTLSKRDMEKIIKTFGANAILDLEMNGKSYHVMLKEVQRDPILGDILHADFQQVSKTQKVQVSVPIHLENTEILHKEGALVVQLDVLEIQCVSDIIPMSINHDVKDMQVGDTLTVADLDVDEGIEILDDPEHVVASLSPFTTEEDLEASEEDEAAEPEVIGESDEEEETEE